MSRVLKPKYRVEYSGNFPITPAAWSGHATAKRLEAHTRHLNKSFRAGGCNGHLAEPMGFIPYLSSATIIRQYDGHTMCTWEAPAFEVFE